MRPLTLLMFMIPGILGAQDFAQDSVLRSLAQDLDRELGWEMVQQNQTLVLSPRLPVAGATAPSGKNPGKVLLGLSPRKMTPGTLVSQRYSLTWLTSAKKIPKDLKSWVEARLYLVISKTEELEKFSQRPVAIQVTPSREVNQGRFAPPAGHGFSQWVKLGGDILVIYTPAALQGNGPWDLGGRTVILSAEAPDPRRKDTVQEVHFAGELLP